MRTAAKIAFVGGTTALAAVTGGVAAVSALAVHTAAGLAAYKVNKEAYTRDTRKDRRQLKEAFESMDKADRCDLQDVVDKGVAEADFDHAAVTVGSVILGAVTFANPLIGGGLLAASLLGRTRKCRDG